MTGATEQTADHWILALALVPHPEGGSFHRSAGSIPKDALPNGFDGDRSYVTVIYFLLRANEFSAFHRIRSDETWHFHAGAPITIHEIRSAGPMRHRTLGLDPEAGAVPVCVVPGGSWFGGTCAYS
jgi:hypothetical protein